jgi:hypothetical protein
MGVVNWVVIVVVVVGVIIALFGWDRYRVKRKDGVEDRAFQPTSEVFIDPTTDERTRVWYNPKTGQREYRAEPENHT